MAGREPRHRRPLPLLARRAALRIPRRNRPAGPHPQRPPARPGRPGPAPALPAGGRRQRADSRQSASRPSRNSP
jgi:hypothetical protein